MITIKEQCKKAIEDYTGVKVKEIEVVEDNKVEGCYAMKAVMCKRVCGKNTLYFLKTHSDPISYNTIEDVEFTSWPPKSGSLKFI